MRRVLLSREEAVECPRCSEIMGRTVGADRESGVWILQCKVCLRSVVIVEPAGQGAP